MFGKRKPEPQAVTNGRFEMERDGHVAYLEYSLAGPVLQLVHTEVPPPLRRRGIADQLAQSALEWARQNQAKVDVICPIVAGYLKKHPQYADLVLR